MCIEGRLVLVHLIEYDAAVRIFRQQHVEPEAAFFGFDTACCVPCETLEERPHLPLFDFELGCDGKLDHGWPIIGKLSSISLAQAMASS